MPDPSARRVRAGRPSYAVVLLTAACVLVAATEGPSARAPSFSAVDAPGAIRTDFYGINNTGQIVGEYTDAAGNHHPFLRSAAGTISGFTVTGADPGRTEAAGINDSGQIVGTFLDAAGTVHCYVASVAGAVSTIIDLPAKGPTANEAGCYGINNTGSIVGELGARAFIRSPAGAVTFVNLKRAAAAGINNAGQVVGGYAINDSTDNTRGFLWTPGGAVTTFDVRGAVSTNPNSINNKGEVAGSFKDTGGRVHGFIRSAAGTAAYDAPGAIETQVTGLNDAKRIVGIFRDAAGKWHGFLAVR